MNANAEASCVHTDGHRVSGSYRSKADITLTPKLAASVERQWDKWGNKTNCGDRRSFSGLLCCRCEAPEAISRFAQILQDRRSLA